jgi:diacylglycerol O-acyltransferase / wax synthase
MLRPIPAMDLAFLLADRPRTPANVGALLLFEPPAGRNAAGVAREVLRAYRAARPAPPFDCTPELPPLGLPRWRTAPQVDLRRHVRIERLAPPGTEARLWQRVAQLHESPLDRQRPLFEVHLLHGLTSGRLALYVKSHHASWDGRYALERLFDSLGEAPGELRPPFFAAPAAATGPTPGAAAPSHAAALSGLLGHAAGLATLAAALATRLRTPDADSGPVAGNRPFAGPHTRFNERVQAGRGFACLDLPLEAMRAVAHAAGGTLNDVVLAVVDAGVATYLAAHGERPAQPLVAMCPVSQRDPGDHEATNKSATLFLPLGAPRATPAARLRRIVASSRQAKKEFARLPPAAVLDYALAAFGLWFATDALGLRDRMPPVVNLTVSNVGAVVGERFLGNSRLVAACPVSMLADPVGLNVTVLSAAGRMHFGLIANAAAVPDVDRLARACATAWTILARGNRRAATRNAATRPRRRAPRALKP